MKKLLIAALSAALLGAASLPVLAAGGQLSAPGYSIEIDGEEIEARACVMVPLRAVAEKLGFSVDWNSGTITVTGDGRYVTMTLGKDEYFAAPTEKGLMGASLFSLGCAPCSINGSTYVPLELFDTLLGCRAGTTAFDGDTIQINTVQAAAPDQTAE